MKTAEPQPQPKRAAPLILWRALRKFLELIFSLFGAPEDIAARDVLRRKEYMLILPWLRAGEAFLRRLLFLEALALVGDLPAPAKTSRLRSPRQRIAVASFPDKPGEWPVWFRVFEPSSVRHSRTRNSRMRREPMGIAPAFCTESCAKPGRPAWSDYPATPPANRGSLHRSCRDFPNAWPVAERLEAMLRAFNDPHACARRLARGLQRDAGCAERVLRPQSPRVAGLFGRYFEPCGRIAEKRRRSWAQAHAPPDGG